jgi:23S rRNA pseudouridine1911/1915/1917 synthase
MRRALQAGKIFVRGVPTSDGGRDVEASEITVRMDAPRLRPGRDLVVLHRDRDVVVVWKPAGMLSVPARGRPDGHLSVLGLVERITRGPALPVHRIDEPTSGLLMVARNATAQTILKEQLELHTVERRYRAIVSGHPPPTPTRYESTFVRDRGDGLRGSAELWQVRPNEDNPGRHAATVIQRVSILDRRTSLVEATLETGRTHQLRIHLAEAGFSILADPLYATQSVASRGSRLALHAAVLGFVHPRSGEALRFVTRLPDDLEQLRRGLLVESEGSQRPGSERDGRESAPNRRKSRGKSGRGKSKRPRKG